MRFDDPAMASICGGVVARTAEAPSTIPVVSLPGSCATDLSIERRPWTGAANVGVRDGIDLGNNLLARNHATPGQKLAGDALDPPPGALESRKKADLHLRLGTGDLDLVDVGRGAPRALQGHIDQFGDIG